MIWGAGSTSRKRAELLTRHGINISHYIDVDPKKVGQQIRGRPVILLKNIPPSPECFIASYVESRGVNEQILKYLNKFGCQLGKDFIFVA